jgi:hypothetical protein
MTTKPDLELAESIGHPNAKDETTTQRDFRSTPRKHTARRDNSPDRFQINTIWEQVKQRNSAGRYNFEHFEAMQLLDLCLRQHNLRKLSNKVLGAINNHKNVYPDDEAIRERAARL